MTIRNLVSGPLATALLFLFLAACSSPEGATGQTDADDCTALGERSPYTILRDQTDPVLNKFSVDLQLNEPITEEQLKTNAEIIKCENPGFERYFITYFLPGYKLDAGAWAISHFTPDLEVRIVALQG